MSRPAVVKIEIVQIVDENPDLSYLQQTYNDCRTEEAEEYMAQDRKRIEQYNNGNWCMICIKAIATMQVPIDTHTAIYQTIESGGLWGIESDSGNEYFKEIGDQELEQLKVILQAMNIEIPDIVPIETFY